ncbi:hypothetical protein RHGRI_004107 [Rhododendron griersonianum]|uniref:Uncharacterized protein n=1 Tax=Rhododendron griersonianum TaxID=479676 RepID=A0AAV6L874_9ERIC|nr:hypothetical protein RHGRI_004107 [Rhododendron griersonianum]
MEKKRVPRCNMHIDSQGNGQRSYVHTHSEICARQTGCVYKIIGICSCFHVLVLHYYCTVQGNSYSLQYTLYTEHILKSF